MGRASVWRGGEGSKSKSRIVVRVEAGREGRVCGGGRVGIVLWMVKLKMRDVVEIEIFERG